MKIYRAYQKVRELTKDYLYENPLTLITEAKDVRIFVDSKGITIMQESLDNREYGISSRWFEVK